jgi:Carboxypeptidase regulatory-like domain
MYPKGGRDRLLSASHWASRFLVIGFLAALSLAQSKEGRSAISPKPSPGRVSGHVYRTDTGEPIAKAQVSLSPSDENTAKGAEQRIVRTGADGAFTFADIPAGNYHIEAWHNGYSEFSGAQVDGDRVEPGRSNMSISLKPDQTIENLVLHLYAAGVISGQALDEDQDPVPGLAVFALRVSFVEGGQRQIFAAAKAVTDDLGNYRMANLSPGSYYVRAGGLMNHPMEQVGLKEGPSGRVQYQNTFYPGTPLVTEAQAVHVGPMAEAGDVRFTVPAERTFTLRGKVLRGTGAEGIRAEEVRCASPADIGYNFGSGTDTAAVEGDGSFKISGLPPGDFTLTATSLNQGAGTDVGYAVLHVSDSDVRADVEIGQAAEIRGTVKAPPGVSLRGRRISAAIFGPGFYLLHQSSELDPTGRFDIKNIPPGDFTLSLSQRGGDESIYLSKAMCGGRDYAAREFALTVDSRLDCDITLARDTGMVHGQVTSTDKPVPGVLVVIIPAAAEPRKVPRYTLTSVTDDAGQYKIADVIPGNYLLFAVRKSSDHFYFDLGFADRNTAAGEGVTINPGTVQTVDLKLSGLN